MKQKSLLNNIYDVFYSYARDRGFFLDRNESIFPQKEDKSIIFINSVIAKYKDLIANESIPESCIASKQECIRLNNLKTLDDFTVNKPYLSCFNMLGVVAGKKKGQEITSFFCELLSQGYKLTEISVEYSSLNPLAGDIPSFIECIEDIDNPNKYRWKFGLDGIYGVGAYFRAKTFDGKDKDIGQIIELRDNQDDVIGYECAIGAERISRLQNNYNKSIQSYAAYDIVNEKYGENGWRLMDGISTLSLMYSSGLSIKDKSRQALEMKKILSKVCHIADVLKISSEQIISDFKDYNSLFLSIRHANSFKNELECTNDRYKRNVEYLRKRYNDLIENKNLNKKKLLKLENTAVSEKAIPPNKWRDLKNVNNAPAFD